MFAPRNSSPTPLYGGGDDLAAYQVCLKKQVFSINRPKCFV